MYVCMYVFMYLLFITFVHVSFFFGVHTCRSSGSISVLQNIFHIFVCMPSKTSSMCFDVFLSALHKLLDSHYVLIYTCCYACMDLSCWDKFWFVYSHVCFSEYFYYALSSCPYIHESNLLLCCDSSIYFILYCFLLYFSLCNMSVIVFIFYTILSFFMSYIQVLTTSDLTHWSCPFGLSHKS
jgi:hypothetical protein